MLELFFDQLSIFADDFGLCGLCGLELGALALSGLSVSLGVLYDHRNGADNVAVTHIHRLDALGAAPVSVDAADRGPLNHSLA